MLKQTEAFYHFKHWSSSSCVRMHNTRQGAQTRPKWDLSLVPQPCRPLTVAYLKKVERAHRKAVELKKLEWTHEHSFEPHSTLFRDGKTMVHKVVEMDSQKKIHDSTFELRKGFLQKEVDDTKKDSNEAFAALKKKLEEYKAHLARVTSDWIVGDHTGDVYRAAVEQISENSVNIVVRLDSQYDRWVEHQKTKSLKKATRVQNSKIVKEAFIEDTQANKPIAEQISDLRLALKQVLGSDPTSLSHGSRQPKNSRRPPHGGGTRSGSNTSGRSANSNRRRSSSNGSHTSHTSYKSAKSNKSNKSNKSAKSNKSSSSHRSVSFILNQKKPHYRKSRKRTHHGETGHKKSPRR